MKKVVLITNYFHFKEEKESNRYRILADMISAEKDINLELITSRFYQRTKTYRYETRKLTQCLTYKVTFIEEPGYKKNISFQRLYTSKIFANNVIRYLKTIPKPDVIYQVVPTLDVANVVSRYAEKNSIPLIIDIQDLWPEAFKIALNIPIISDVLFLPQMIKANKIYKRADAICAVSETYVDRALKENKKVATGHPVFIGINLDAFDDNISNIKKKKSDCLKLAYCGSLDKSYDIKLVIDALKQINNPPIFIVMGDGLKRMEYYNYAKSKGVKAEFTGYLPYSEMCRQLYQCDMAVNPIIGESVASIINKHGDYAASGLPVLNTQKSIEYMKLVEDYQMGFNCINKASDLAKKIFLLCENEQLRNQMGKNSRRCAEEKFNRDTSYKEIVKTIRNIIDK